MAAASCRAASAARSKLHAALSEEARETYWSAFSRFLGFELSKVDFDTVALKALGPNVPLHNALIMALLKDAQSGPRPEQPEPAVPMEVDAAGTLPLPPGFAPMPVCMAGVGSAGVGPAGISRAGGDLAGAGTAGKSAAPALERSASAASASAAPKIMLKISTGAGGVTASSQRVALTVDPQEEAQLNALHERLIELARSRGLHTVQPEAVSYMARAVKVATNRLIVAAALGGAERIMPECATPLATPSAATNIGAATSAPTGAAALSHADSLSARRSISADDLYDAMRHPAPAQWMAPPSQLVARPLSALDRFVP